jgi:hypothetical protein
MAEDLNELKDLDKNKKLIQLWLEQNPDKTEQDLLDLLLKIKAGFERSGKWLDSELEKIRRYNNISGDI